MERNLLHGYSHPVQAAKRFFSKVLAAPHISTSRVIAVDKNAAYPKAFKELKAEEIMPASCELRQSKYLKNLIEQDHCLIKRLVKLGMGFFSFKTAWRTWQGYTHDEHAPERSDIWRRQAREHETGGIHRQPVWSGCLN